MQINDLTIAQIHPLIHSLIIVKLFNRVTAILNK